MLPGMSSDLVYACLAAFSSILVCTKLLFYLEGSESSLLAICFLSRENMDFILDLS